MLWNSLNYKTSTTMPRHSHKNILTFKQICNRHLRAKQIRNALKHSRLNSIINWSSMEHPSKLLKTSSSSSSVVRTFVFPGRSRSGGSLQAPSDKSVVQPVLGGSQAGNSMDDYFLRKEKRTEEALNPQPNNQNYLHYSKITNKDGLPSQEPGTVGYSNLEFNSDPLDQVPFLEPTNTMYTETKQIDETKKSSIDPKAINNSFSQTTPENREHKFTIESCPISFHSEIEFNYTSDSKQQALSFRSSHFVDGATENKHGFRDNGDWNLPGPSQIFFSNEMQTGGSTFQDFQKLVEQSTRKHTSSALTALTQAKRNRKLITYSFKLFISLFDHDEDKSTAQFAKRFLEHLERMNPQDFRGNKIGFLQNLILIVQLIGQVIGVDLFNDILRNCNTPPEFQQNDRDNTEDRDNSDNRDSSEYQDAQNVSMHSENVDMNESQPKNGDTIEQENNFSDGYQLSPDIDFHKNDLNLSESARQDADYLLNNIKLSADVQFDIDNSIIDDVDCFDPIVSDSIGIDSCGIPGDVNKELINKITVAANEYPVFNADMMSENFAGGIRESYYDKTNCLEALKTLNLCAEQGLISDESDVEPTQAKFAKMSLSDIPYPQVATNKSQAQISYIKLEPQSRLEENEDTDKVMLHDGILESLIGTPEAQFHSVPDSGSQLPAHYLSYINDLSVNELGGSHGSFKKVSSPHSPWSQVQVKNYSTHQGLESQENLLHQGFYSQDNLQTQLCQMDFTSQATSDPLAMPQVDFLNEALLNYQLASSMEIPAETAQDRQVPSRKTRVDGSLLLGPQTVQGIKKEHSDYYYEAEETDNETKPDIKQIRKKMRLNQESRKSTRKKRVPDRLFYIGRGQQF